MFPALPMKKSEVAEMIRLLTGIPKEECSLTDPATDPAPVGIQVGSSGTASSTARGQPEGREDPPRRVMDWLVPGRRWQGKITIPGSPEENTPTNYYFEIYNSSANTLYARHADDHDKQAVIVSVDGSKLRWHDFETYVEAQIDVETGNITGRVHQLKEGGDVGFWYSSQDLVHTCFLEPQNVDLTAVQRRFERMRMMARLLANIGNLLEDTQVYPKEMPWLELFDEACTKSMLFQADLRAEIMRLQKITFVTEDEKREKVKEVLGADIESGIRMQTHTRANQCSKDLRLHLVYIKFVGCLNEDDSRIIDWQFEIVETRSRRAYDQLDTAIRQFEARVSDEVLNRHILALMPTDAQCAICLEDEEDSWIQLPCKDTFHQSCARSWFHRSCECPCCRSVLA